jgi:hypothetical protein
VKRGDVWASYMFAVEATVVCHALLFAEGKRRAAFVDRRPPLPESSRSSPPVAFGMSPDGGAMAVAWAAK